MNVLLSPCSMVSASPEGGVSIIVPAWREEKRIGNAIDGLRQFADQYALLDDILIVVEPGGDQTAELARQKAGGDRRFRVVENSVHRGKGHAVRRGMLEARGDIIFFMDADLSVPLVYVPPFVTHFEQRPDLAGVIGNRRHPGSIITKRQHPLREKAGRVFNQVVRLLGLHVSRDTQCGFKAFRRAAAQQIFSQAQIDGFAFDTEILLLAQLHGMTIQELPVEWINDPQTKFRPVRDGFRSFYDLMRIKRLLRLRRLEARSPARAG